MPSHYKIYSYNHLSGRVAFILDWHIINIEGYTFTIDCCVMVKFDLKWKLIEIISPFKLPNLKKSKKAHLET